MAAEREPTAGLVLAAGASFRLGRPKQLLTIGDATLLERVATAAAASRLTYVVVVLGHEAAAIRSALSSTWNHPKIRPLVNPKYRDGMASSLKAGLASIRLSFASVMVILGDQPFINPHIIDFLLEQFWKSDKGICMPFHKGRKGPPVCFSETYYGELMALEGDIGARKIIAGHPEDVLWVDVGTPDLFMDVDTVADLRRARGMAKTHI